MSIEKETIEIRALRDAVATIGSQAELARRLSETPEAKKRGRSLKQQNIHSWFALGGVPTPWVLPVSRLTGIPAHRLDPDAYPRGTAA
jgi:hypothetical protein